MEISTEQRRTQHHAPDRIRHLHGGEQAGDQGQHDGPGHAAPVTALAAGEQRPAHGHGSDGRKEERLAERDEDHPGIADHQEASEARQRPRQRIDGQVHAGDINAESRAVTRLTPSANRFFPKAVRSSSSHISTPKSSQIRMALGIGMLAIRAGRSGGS